ncbi:hypothetical protein N9R79_07290 [Vibrio sp.]|nr:hypothetical protein [Vibrio sp.]
MYFIRSYLISSIINNLRTESNNASLFNVTLDNKLQLIPVNEYYDALNESVIEIGMTNTMQLIMKHCQVTPEETYAHLITSPDLSLYLSNKAKYYRYYESNITLKTSLSGTTLKISITADNVPRHLQSLEAVRLLSNTLTMFSDVHGKEYQPNRVALPKGIYCNRVIESLLSSPVEYINDECHIDIWVTSQDVLRPVKKSSNINFNHRSHTMNTNLIELMSMPSPDSMTSTLEAVLLYQALFTYPTIIKTAAIYKMDKQKLQRQLAKESTSFQIELKRIEIRRCCQLIITDGDVNNTFERSIYRSKKSLERTFKQLKGLTIKEYKDAISC